MLSPCRTPGSGHHIRKLQKPEFTAEDGTVHAGNKTADIGCFQVNEKKKKQFLKENNLTV